MSNTNLSIQSDNLKMKVNKEVEAVFDRFMSLSAKEKLPESEAKEQLARLQGVIQRIEWLKKVKDAICE